MRKKSIIAALGLVLTALAPMSPTFADNANPVRDVSSAKSSEPPRPAPGAKKKERISGCDVLKKNLSKIHEAAPGKRQAACIDPKKPSALKLPRPEARATTIQPLPDWCEDAIDAWMNNRTEACMIEGANLVVLEVPSGRPIGGFEFNVFNFAYTSPRLTAWAQQQQVSIYSAWGQWAGTTVHGVGGCTGDCTPAGGSFPPQPLRLNEYPGGEFFFESTATAAGAIGTADTEITAFFTNPAWATPVLEAATAVPFSQVRCDNALPGNVGAGCVFPDFWPTMTYSKTGPYPELADHIADAQASGLPGAPDDAPLHRLTDPVKSDQNRRKACPDSLPRPPGKSCDEYPMASTHEGASTGSGQFSRRMIDATQNSNGGTDLNTFHLQNRVIENDAFYVLITP